MTWSNAVSARCLAVLLCCSLLLSVASPAFGQGTATPAVQLSGDAGTTSSALLSLATNQPVGIHSVSAGAYHTCAVTTAGGVMCWGSNRYGQLGDGTRVPRATAVDVVGLAGSVVAVSAGGYHTCALSAEGAVSCWGYNDYGQLGDGTTTDRLTPVQVVGLDSGVVAISAGEEHTCAATTAGGAVCWGRNSYGQLGDGTSGPRNNSRAPVQVVGLTDVAAVSAGAYHTCAVTTAGSVSCWGRNTHGQLGNGSSGSHNGSARPVGVTGLDSGIAAVSAGGYHTCALSAEGGVMCWGRNLYGQLGDGSSGVRNSRENPVDVIGLSGDVVAISAGGYHTCALSAEGVVSCWGYNDYGQLGGGRSSHRSSPVEVVGLGGDIAAVSAGKYHTCAATATGDTECWGFVSTRHS